MNDIPIWIHFKTAKKIFHEGKIADGFQKAKTLCGRIVDYRDVNILNSSPDVLFSPGKGGLYEASCLEIRLCVNCQKAKMRTEVTKNE